MSGRCCPSTSPWRRPECCTSLSRSLGKLRGGSTSHDVTLGVSSLASHVSGRGLSCLSRVSVSRVAARPLLPLLTPGVRAWQVRCHQGMSNARTLLSDHLMADLHAQVSKCVTCPCQVTCQCQVTCPFQLPVPHISRGVGTVRCDLHVQ